MDVKRVVLLVGDSILDNAYWNDVGADTTAEVLKRSGISVIDRTTEEITTNRFFETDGITVADHYVKSRKDKGIPYDGKQVGDDFKVQPIPESTNKLWNTNKENRYVVLSLGGNDLVLQGKLNAKNILFDVSNVIKRLIKEANVFPTQFIYIIPYPINDILAAKLKIVFKKLQMDITVDQFYSGLVREAKKMCKELNIICLSLEDFTDKDRSNAHIPEPTKLGAKKIAERIIKIIDPNFKYIKDFCEYPNHNNFSFIDDYGQYILYETALFCIKNNIGNIDLARKIIEIYNIKNLSNDQLSGSV